MTKDTETLLAFIGGVDEVIKAYDRGHGLYTSIDRVRRLRASLWSILEAQEQKTEQEEVNAKQ